MIVYSLSIRSVLNVSNTLGPYIFDIALRYYENPQ
jgi:hypothetical protein